MEKSSHIFLQDIDLKSNKITNVSSLSKGDDNISLGTDEVSVTSESFVVKNGDGNLLKVTDSESKLITDELEIDADTVMKSGDTEVSINDSEISMSSDTLSVESSSGLKIVDDGENDSLVKSDISESKTSKTGEIILGGAVKIIVEDGSLCFVKQE